MKKNIKFWLLSRVGVLLTAAIILVVFFLVLNNNFFSELFHINKVHAAWLTNWNYRKAVTITNTSGSPVSNYQTLVELDTASLISAGKLQADCDDIRFTDNDGTTLLNYWIEGGCNTSTTQVWVTETDEIAAGGSVDIYFYYNNNSTTIGSQTWTNGFFVLGNSGTCPSGWTRVTDLDGKIPRGNTTYGGIGGTAAHTHTFSGTADTYTTATGNGDKKNTSGSTPYTGSHNHTVSSISTGSGDNTPLDMQTIFCKNSDLNIPVNSIAMFSSLAVGWTSVTALNDSNRFPIGSASYGTLGGGSTHSHSYSGSTDNSSATANNSSTGTTTGSHGTHNHTFSGTSGTQPNLPPFIDLSFGQKTSQGPATSGLIAMTNTAPPQGWTLYSAVNDTNRFPRGANTGIGNTGGSSSSHTHIVSNANGTMQGPSAQADTNSQNGSIVAVNTHTHTYNFTSSAVDPLPPYMDVIFIQRNTPVTTVSLGAEMGPNNPPDTPTSLSQYKSDCTTAISVGGWTNETSVCLKGNINDADTNDQVKLQTEVTTGSFSGTPNYTASAYTTEPNTSSISIAGLPNGSQYRWQARSIDDDGDTSSFAQFNSGNLSFGIDTTAPSGGSITLTDGYYTSLSVGLTASDGTDSVSGINTSTRVVQRRSANLVGGTCASYSSFSTITPSGSYPNYTDTTVTSGNCYQYQYLVSDNAGNQATYNSGNTAKVDADAPTSNSISINSGDVYTSSATVTLALSSTDSVSGLSQMQFSCDNSNWTTAEAYNTSKSFNITNQSGAGCTVTEELKTVYARYKDTAGNWSTAANDTITYDASAPSVTSITSVAGDGSAPYYDTTDDSSTVVAYASSADAQTCKWNTTDVAYDSMSNTCASTSSCTLNLSGEGAKIVYMRCMDQAGNKASSSYTLNYTIDASAPSSGSINYVDGSYGSLSVGLTASDGTDSVSGINTSTRVVQRRSANLVGGTCASYSSFSTITPSGSYPNYTDTTVTSGNCYQYQYLVSDNAGNQATYNSGNTAKVEIADPDPPVGGSITYLEGYYTSLSVGITVNDGTDSDSGINESSRIVQRKSATLTGGVCGSYGSFSTITPTGTYPNFTDNTVTSGNCYQYQYLVSDNASNQATYTSSNTVRIDIEGPTGAGISNIAADSKTQLTVTASVPTDLPSGLNSAPYWFEETTNNSGSSDSTDWQAGVTFVDSGLSPNTQYTYRVKAKDALNNESAYSATSSKYTLANQVTGISAADATTKSNHKINLSWTNQGQSGIKIEQDTNCDGYETTVYINASSVPSSPYTIDVSANTCYKFKITSYNGDGVLNTVDSAPETSQITSSPSQPIGLTHTNNTNSSISWNWDDVTGATGYKIYRDSDNQLLNTLSSATSQWSQDSLSSDTQYSVYVRATNANGEGIASLSASAYTSADTPTNPGHSANTTSSINWNWTSGGSQKDFYAWCQNPSANSGWIIGTSWLQDSLSANSLYQLFVKARNEENDETASATTSQFTSQNTPTGISFDNVATNSITISAQGTLSNLSSNSSGLYFKNNTDSQNSGWTQTNSWINSSLSPNTQYAYQIKARNGDTDETSYTVEQTKYTLANVPAAPAVTSPSSNSLQVIINQNSNPAATEYAIYETATGKYVDSADGSLDQASAQWHTYALWSGSSGITVTGLTGGTTYNFQVKARNADGVNTTLSTTTSLSTLNFPNAPTLVSPASGSNINDNTPTLSARYSDNDFGDTGTTSYRISSTNLTDCKNNTNIVASGTSPETTTNDQNTTWTPGSSIGSDQTYYWCAQNNDGTNTSSWTDMGSFLLDTQAPNGATLSFTGVTSTSVSVQVSGAADNGSGLHATPYYFLNSTKPANSSWQTSTSWENISLIPNTTYSFQVKARDAAGNESSYTVAQEEVTLANLPANFALTVNSLYQITANWSGNGNSAGTEYYVENMTKGTNSGWITTTSWASDWLDADTSYTFRIKARNSSHEETNWSAEISETTTIVTPTIIGTSDDNGDNHHHHHHHDNTYSAASNAISQTVSIIPNYISKLPEVIDKKLNEEKTAEEIIPEATPLSLNGEWNLVSVKPMGEFLSAYPKDLQEILAKFPDLSNFYSSLEIADLVESSGANSSLNIANLVELSRINNIPFALPGLNQLAWNGKNPDIYTSVPVSQFPTDIKNKLPNEIILAQMAGGNIDLPVYLSVSQKGEPVQKINAISGKKITLVLKPGGEVKNIKGYLLFKSVSFNTPDPSTASLSGKTDKSRQSLSDSDAPAANIWEETFMNDIQPIFLPLPAQAQETASPNIETGMLTSEFEFTDPDGDGIYEAEIQAPVTEGNYEVVTIINYKDPALGQKELRLVTVVDPEGYVFRKIDEDELRVKNARISIYAFNKEANNFELWSGNNFHQDNPQTTDNTGKYSFLVPPGKYYLAIEAPGYEDYTGKEFVVSEGEGIHQNIELRKKFSLSDIDWKSVFLILVIIFLGINFWRDRQMKRLIKYNKINNY